MIGSGRVRTYILLFFALCVTDVYPQTYITSPRVLAPPAGKIKVTFKVSVPENTPVGDIIYLMGSMNNWDPGPASPPDSSDIPLTFDVEKGWQTILYLSPETTYYYKYTRGSMESVEKGSDSSDIKDRSIYVSDEVEPVLEDIVQNWADLSIRTVPENVTPILSMFNSTPHNSVAITWVSDTTGESIIQYGKLDITENTVLVNNHYDLMKKDDNLIHYYLLNDLDPDTEYRYKVSTKDVFESEEFSFRTAPAEGNNSKFVVWGDNRPNVNLELNALVMEENPDFILHAGDMVQNGQELKDWYKFFSDYKRLVGKFLWLAVYGNHEEQAYLNKFFQLPKNHSLFPEDEGHWFSLDFKNIHIIGLDIYRDFTDGSEQRKWLLNDLRNIKDNIDFVIAVFHEPPFSSGKYEDNVAIRDDLIPLLDKFNVDLIFCGHDHIYERSIKKDLIIVITGGAGSELYQITPGKNPYSIFSESIYHYCRVNVIEDYLKVDMVRADGSVGDTFEIDKRNTNPDPDKYFLSQNFPNPFNSSTFISYNIPDNKYVTLKLYDLLGREVKNLYSGERNAGSYRQIFTADNLASGVYFYQLTAGDFRSVKKMLLLK